MSEGQLRRFGLVLAGVHLAIVAFLLLSESMLARGGGLPFEALMVLDLPISLVTIFLSMLTDWMSEIGAWLIHGVLGTLWYYFLPRLLLPTPDGPGNRG